MTPSAFEIARTTGNNFSRRNRERKDNSTIERILNEALDSGDPEVVKDSIGQLISQVSPEKQGVALQFLQGQLQQVIKKKEADKTGQAYKDADMEGYDKFPPQVQAQMLKGKQRDSQYDRIFPQGQQQPNSQPQQNMLGAQDPSLDPRGQAQPQGQQGGLGGFSEEQLMQGLAIPELKPVFQAELDKRYQEKKLKQDANIANTKRKSKRADKILDWADEISRELPNLQSSLNQWTDAIRTGNLGFFSLNNLADLTGVEGFRDPKGAQFKTASKEYLIGTLGRIKGRPNQWIEQQVLDSAAKIGRDQASNLISTRALQNEVDLKSAFVEVANRINEEYELKHGEPPRNLASLVSKEMKVVAEEKETEMFNDFRAILSIYDKKHMPFKPVKKGSELSDLMLDGLLARFNNDPKKAENEARKLGYSVE